MTNITIDNVWQSANNLHDLGELTAQWLEGSIKGNHPFGYTQPNTETRLITPTLARINRKGMVTWTSQPGSTPSSPWPDAIMAMQRADVAFYTSHETAMALIDQVKATHLSYIVYGPNELRQIDWDTDTVVVSREFGKKLSWLNTECEPEQLYDVTYAGYCHTPDSLRGRFFGSNAIAQALVQSTQMFIYDPEWGRNDRLWPMLDEFCMQA